jgi:hypothetical protein
MSLRHLNERRKKKRTVVTALELTEKYLLQIERLQTGENQPDDEEFISWQDLKDAVESAQKNIVTL